MAITGEAVAPIASVWYGKRKCRGILVAEKAQIFGDFDNAEELCFVDFLFGNRAPSLPENYKSVKGGNGLWFGERIR